LYVISIVHLYAGKNSWFICRKDSLIVYLQRISYWFSGIRPLRLKHCWCAWHDSFICRKDWWNWWYMNRLYAEKTHQLGRIWLLHLKHCWCAWHDSFICRTWLIDLMWHDSFICSTIDVRDVTHLYVGHDSLIWSDVTRWVDMVWLLHLKYHSCAWRDWFICRIRPIDLMRHDSLISRGRTPSFDR